MIRRRVVITGVGCVTPIGSRAEFFWNALSRGQSGISGITHFDSSNFDVKLAGEVKENVSYPDHFFRFVQEDSKIAFALNAVSQAMQDANMPEFPGSSLLHIGTSLESFDLHKIIQGKNPSFKDIVLRAIAPGARPLQMPLDTACELIESLYGRTSLKLTNVGACVASTQAIGHSFRRIRDGRFEMALCGGFDSMINPLGVGGFQLLGALTTNNGLAEKACRPFDVGRSGTVLGEGAAMFVLEPLDAAMAKGRRIYAEILGYGTSLDAYKLSAPDPGGTGAFLAMQSALADASLESSKIDAVSAHGTGTYLNDEVEASAIRKILGEKWKTTPVISTKSLVGHLIGAAGAIELLASIQGFDQNKLHHNISLENVARDCELDHIVGAPREFKGRYIMKNSFGFGGQNATLIIGRGSDYYD